MVNRQNSLKVLRLTEMYILLPKHRFIIYTHSVTCFGWSFQKLDSSDHGMDRMRILKPKFVKLQKNASCDFISRVRFGRWPSRYQPHRALIYLLLYFSVHAYFWLTHTVTCCGHINSNLTTILREGPRSQGASWGVCGCGLPPYDFLNLYGVFDSWFSISFP